MGEDIKYKIIKSIKIRYYTFLIKSLDKLITYLEKVCWKSSLRIKRKTKNYPDFNKYPKLKFIIDLNWKLRDAMQYFRTQKFYYN